MSIQPLRRDPRLQAVPRPRPGQVASAGRPSSCVVVDDLSGAAGAVRAEALRGKDPRQVVLLAHRADAADLCDLLTQGLRGAVVTTPNLPEPVHVDVSTELSGREIGVLRLVAQGCSNRETGDRLGLSALTVKSHLARISRKLGTGDRAQLVAIAVRSGALD